MTEHVHQWYLPETFFVIDTYPPLRTYECRGCDAESHDRVTVCAIRHGLGKPAAGQQTVAQLEKVDEPE